MIGIPSWDVIGDWFDNCNCAVACPCTFGQPPDNGFCESVLFGTSSVGTMAMYASTASLCPGVSMGRRPVGGGG